MCSKYGELRTCAATFSSWWLGHVEEGEKHPFTDKSHHRHKSQIAERRTVGEQGPGDRGTEPHTIKSQAHTTNGTRARGRRKLGQKPRPCTGAVPEIPGAVERHRAHPSEVLCQPRVRHTQPRVRHTQPPRFAAAGRAGGASLCLAVYAHEGSHFATDAQKRAPVAVDPVSP